MALRLPWKEKPVARHTIASRSFVFPDMGSAKQFQAEMLAGNASNSRSTWMAYADSSFLAGKYGGQMFRSSTARELRVYGYQAQILENDRQYLFARDPTAAMFIEKPWTDMWNGFPQSYITEVDTYFSEQLALGLLSAFQAAYQEYYQEGGGCILLETDGDPATPLRRGERPLAWTFIPANAIVDDEQGPNGYVLASTNNTDRLLDHGIEYLSVYPTELARTQQTPLTVHGSRIIPVNLDPRKQKWWRTPNVPLHRIYDTLWELRDIIFSRARAHFQGDPIVVDVDLSSDAQKALNFGEMDKEQRDAMSEMVETSILDYNAGSKSTFAPVMGFKMRRLGSAQLPDPKEDVMMLSSRLAHGSVFPVKMVLASTKGSTDVGDQDLLIYQGNLQNIRNTWGYKHISRALLMGQVMGANSLRMMGQHDLPAPQELVWPMLRPLSPRDAAFTDKTDVLIYREAQEAGLVPPARLLRKFAQDIRYPIPLWLAARGRDTDGKNTDVAALKEPGAAGDTPAAPTPTVTKTTAASADFHDLEALSERVKNLEEEAQEAEQTPTVHVQSDP